MVKIAPSILSADFMDLGRELADTERAGADMLHIDVMDGHFVPNITIGPFIVEAVRKATRMPLDVHLMIEEPERYIKDFVSAGADYLTVHAEASVHLHRAVQWIKESDVKAGVSINPATSVWALDHILRDVDMVVVMSVNPGFGGQRFISHCAEKIQTLKKRIAETAPHVLIEVDGGVKPDNAKLIADAGADILVMGSAFYGSKDYVGLMRKLRETLNG